jgi:aromatic ring-opening dioxygenase LigB subunit
MQETGGSPYNSNYSDSNQNYARKRDLKDQVYQSKRYSPFSAARIQTDVLKSREWNF